MWNAAMESKSCQLTALGEHYQNLVVKIDFRLVVLILYC